MKQAPSSSWSIRDVPLETREQAAAAAGREGLSVGDWLARNIIADAGVSGAQTRREDSPVLRSVAASVSAQKQSRIDEALVALARLLESHERAQEQASSAMQDVTSEIEAAVRSQSATLQNLDRRVGAVERRSGDVAQRGSETAARLTALAVDLEALGRKIVSARETSDRLGEFVHEQLSAIAEHMRASEARMPNSAQLEQAVSRLGDSYAGAAGRIRDLGASFEKLTADLHTARELSNRALSTMQDRLTSIDSRVRGTEARIAGYAEIERTVHKLNEDSTHAAGQIGALFGSVEKIGGEIASAREETAKLGAAVHEQLSVIAARLQSAEERVGAQPDLGKTIEGLNAQDNAIAAKVSTLASSVAKLQEDMQSTRESAQHANEALQERIAKAGDETLGRLGALSGTVEKLRAEVESVRDGGPATGRVDTALHERIDALEEHAKDTAAALAQSEDAIRILMEQDRQHAGELGTVRDTLARFEDILIAVRDEHRDALNRVDANLGEISAKLTAQPTPAPAESTTHLPHAFGQAPSEPMVQPETAPATPALSPDPMQDTAPEALQPDDPAEITETQSPTANTMGEAPHMVPRDLRTWLSSSGTDAITEGEFELPPHQPEHSSDAVLDLVHEVPGATASNEDAAPTSEPDYLAEARRVAREAHEQVARERGFQANIEKVREKAQSSILRPALLAAILLLLVSWIAFRLTHPVKPAMPAAPHMTTSKIAPAPHKQALAHVQSVPATAQTSVAANTSQTTQARAAAAAFARIKALAENGDPNAMLALGIAYDKGTGVATDENQATAWLQKSAEAGNAVAQFRLGVRLEKGIGAPQDPTEAVHWYRQAAGQGNRSAMYNLGVALANGTGTRKDITEAAREFRSAADLGLRDAQFNLAVMYEHGWGVSQSLADAYQWYCVAAANGDSQSSEHSEALATQISAAQKAAADRSAAAFKAQPLKPQANDLPDIAKPFAS